MIYFCRLFGPDQSKSQLAPSASHEVTLGVEELDDSLDCDVLDVSGLSGMFQSTPSSTPKRGLRPGIEGNQESNKR
jgi:hypothetical protein